MSSVQYPNKAYSYGYKAKKQNLDSQGLCIKYALMALTGFSTCIGLALLGVSLWLVIDRTYVAALFGNELYVVSVIMLVTVSCLTIVINCIGFFGAGQQKRKILWIFIALLGVCALMLLLIAILAIIYRTKIGDEVRDKMTRDIQNKYGQHGEDTLTESWDKTQERLHCCGVLPYGWAVWQGSLWWEDQPGLQESTRILVPQSCCMRDQYGDYKSLELCQLNREGPPHHQDDDVPSAVYHNGCYDEGRNWLWDHSAPLIGVGFAIAILIISNMVLAFLLVTRIQRAHQPNYDKPYNIR